MSNLEEAVALTKKYVDFNNFNREIRITFKDLVSFENQSGLSFNQYLNSVTENKPLIKHMVLFIALATKSTINEVEKRCESLGNEAFFWLVQTNSDCIAAALEGQPKSGKQEKTESQESSTSTGTTETP